MKTSVPKPTAPTWFVIDADGQNLGRIAAKASHMLRGKHKETFSPHQICGDHIIILNVEKLAFTPAKLRRKSYFHHTGYLGHTRVTPLKKMMEERPEEVMEKAIKGMLPYNRMKFQLIKRVHIFRGSKHPYGPQKPVPLSLSDL